MSSRIFRQAALRLSFLVLAAFAGPVAVSAQQVPPTRDAMQQVQRMGMNEDEIVRRLRASGLSREQARSRLRAAGYDPALVDAYYDEMEGVGTGGSLGEPGDDLLSALERIGVSELSALDFAGDSLMADSLALDSLLFGFEVDADSIPIFGRSVFARPTSQFDPVMSGPVDADYRLGPGDQVNVILTGDVELALTLQVTREGLLVIPDVGQISVNGLTLEGLRSRLYDELGQVYSGVRRGDDATTRFTVSLGQLRTHLIYVIGEVERPGAYQVSAAATALDALYRAGGPSRAGSFRRVELRRGSDLVGSLDLYDYLSTGDASGDLRLEQGDVVFVPVLGAQVLVRGQVRRPGLYEMAPGESVDALIQYAGGLRADAFVRRILIDRILPPEVQRPGQERVLVDVDLIELREGRLNLEMQDGDEVEVFAVQEERRNRVELLGAVQRPGEYEYRPGMTLGDLMERSGGPLPDAVRSRVQIRRPVLEDRSVRLFGASLAEAGARGLDFTLQDRDEVEVFGLDSLLIPDSVTVSGQVRNPGRYALAQGATAADLILAAGGFLPGADPFEAEVSRLRLLTEFGDSIALSTAVRLPELPYPDRELLEGVGAGAAASAGAVASDSYALEANDQLFVRSLPGFVPPAQVTIQGEVMRPGVYALETREDRVSELLDRAGGFNPQAYADGFRLLRRGLPVGVDVERALERPGSGDDLVLEDGDVVIVPRLDPTVTIRGQVAFESQVRFRQGLSLDDYLEAAGGVMASGDRRRASVEYPNGERQVVRNRRFWPDRQPTVQPGSVIVVPERDPDETGTNWGGLISQVVQTASSVITILVLVNQLNSP